MSRIRCKNTQPEIVLRSMLHRAGFRFTVNGPLNKSLPGRPDIVLPRYKIAIFVNGCFWHRHVGCKFTYMPKTNTDFWEKKFNKNIERDKKVLLLIKEAGWRAFVVWECELKKDRPQIIERLRVFLKKEIQDMTEEIEDG